MSANNWATCPRCVAKKKAALTARVAEVNDSYGKVSVADFDRMRQELDAQKREQIEATFREDYEIHGAEDGVIQIAYSGGCGTCGLSLTVKHEHPLDVDGTGL